MAIPDKNSWNDREVEAHWDKVALIYVRENNRVKKTHDQRFRESVNYLRLGPGRADQNPAAPREKSPVTALKPKPIISVT